MARSSVSASSRPSSTTSYSSRPSWSSASPTSPSDAVDEPARHERREPELVRAAFGGEPAVHDRERALGVGAVDRRGQREVRAEAVVAARLSSSTCTRRNRSPVRSSRVVTHVDADGLVAAACARPLVADRVRRPPVGGGRRRRGPAPGPTRRRVTRTASGRSTTVSTVGRRVVVGVAAVAAVDERLSPATRDAVGLDGERAVGGVDLDPQVLVGERRGPSARTAVPGPAPSTARYVRQPKPGTAIGRDDDLAHRRARAGGSRWSRPPRRARAARRGRLEVELGLAGRGVVERELDDCRRRACGRSTRAMRAPANSGPRIISSTQRTFWPTTTVEMPSPLDRAHDLGRAARCRRRPRRGAPDRRRGAGRSTSPPRSARGGVHDDGRRRRRVDVGRRAARSASRARPSPIWRASW